MIKEVLCNFNPCTIQNVTCQTATFVVEESYSNGRFLDVMEYRNSPGLVCGLPLQRNGCYGYSIDG